MARIQLRHDTWPPRLALLAVLLAGCVALRLLVYRGLDGTLSWGWPHDDLIQRLRLTAVGVAAIAGASLGGSGVLLQSLLRNPLASPFILGISSGAALGVMISIWMATILGVRWGEAGHTLPAITGALAALAIVFALGTRRGGIDPLALLLVGVVVGAICNALITCLQHLVPHGVRGDLLVWMTGNIREAPAPGLIWFCAALAIGGTATGVLLGRSMDAATLTDDEARSVGVSLGPLRLVQFLLAGALAASAVALTGPIGFVGLVAPHAARMLLGPRHAPLMVGAAIAGAAWLVGADVLSQVLPVRGSRLPVGVFTALVGGPVFVWLLRSGRATS